MKIILEKKNGTWEGRMEREEGEEISGWDQTFVKRTIQTILREERARSITVYNSKRVEESPELLSVGTKKEGSKKA